MSEKRPFFMFPVIGIVLIIVIVFFVVRKRTHKVDVPLQVSETVSHFAPGVAIGSTVKQSSEKLSGMSWVPRVGYVAALPEASGFQQIRLYPDAKTRQTPGGDVKAPVREVEFVSTSSDELTKRMMEMGIVWRGIMPKEGCITSLTVEDPPQRRVQYWTTRSDNGGIALVTDWDLRPNQKPGPVVWSMMTWAGPFQGAQHLHAAFEPRACLDSLNAGDPKTDDATESVETLNVAFRDSVWSGGASVRQAAEELSTASSTPMTAEACSDPGRLSPTQLQTTTLVDIDLPIDFKLTNAAQAETAAERVGYARYEWRGDDNSTLSIFPASEVHSGWTGAIATECDLNIDGHNAHVDIANASTYGADFVVHGYFTMESGSAVGYLAHARSHRRQEELLHALRTVSIKPRWGSRRAE